LRTCPECSERVLLHKPELLDNEDEMMKDLSIRLARITVDSPDYLLDEAKSIIRQLGAYNMRRNITALDEFIAERQRELGIGMRRN